VPYRGPKSAFGAWLLLGFWICALYTIGKLTNWSWWAIGICVFFTVLFVGTGIYLWVSTIREHNRIMKISPDELFPSDLGSRHPK
jgi:hypothetical protein